MRNGASEIDSRTDCSISGWRVLIPKVAAMIAWTLARASERSVTSHVPLGLMASSTDVIERG
eukprot:8319613-Pyramimonas_sp.AAC.1